MDKTHTICGRTKNPIVDNFIYSIDRIALSPQTTFVNITEIPIPASSTIYIFDRMGKLLKQISPTSKRMGWHFRNKSFDANKHWFVLEYEDVKGNQKEFKSHFALKR